MRGESLERDSGRLVGEGPRGFGEGIHPDRIAWRAQPGADRLQSLGRQLTGRHPTQHRLEPRLGKGAAASIVSREVGDQSAHPHESSRGLRTRTRDLLHESLRRADSVPLSQPVVAEFAPRAERDLCCEGRCSLLEQTRGCRHLPLEREQRVIRCRRRSARRRARDRGRGVGQRGECGGQVGHGSILSFFEHMF